ncbi:hypothetical protein F2Q69_00052039 [Brassica cretica]|uniref:Uncharacterized protein n=1 Tax=Brassica cretica TaxID=69181 RepID=A0A8S9N5D4_BRACR|nr:hypothetical protein F2Q69_00052039 [Brassica cretica]
MMIEQGVTKAWSSMVIRVNKTKNEMEGITTGRVKAKWLKHQIPNGLRWLKRDIKDHLIIMGATEEKVKLHGPKPVVEKMGEMVL